MLRPLLAIVLVLAGMINLGTGVLIYVFSGSVPVMENRVLEPMYELDRAGAIDYERWRLSIEVEPRPVRPAYDFQTLWRETATNAAEGTKLYRLPANITLASGVVVLGIGFWLLASAQKDSTSNPSPVSPFTP